MLSLVTFTRRTQISHVMYFIIIAYLHVDSKSIKPVWYSECSKRYCDLSNSVVFNTCSLANDGKR